MTALSAGMTASKRLILLAAHNKDPFHIEHGETVEQTMRYFAREYDPENEEFWGIVGLLNDLDWEEHDDEPEKHTLYAAPLIEEAGGARSSFAPSNRTPPTTTTPTSQAGATDGEDPVRHRGADGPHRRGHRHALEQVGHGFQREVTKKKYKDKRFAAGVSREVIASGAEMLGWELDELFARTIEAMQSFAPDRDTFVEPE